VDGRDKPAHDEISAVESDFMTALPQISNDGTVPSEPPHKNVMDRLIDGIEWIAAFFVGIVALNTFTAVVMRKFFAVTIPDYYNFGQFMLGVLIFWGIAATSYRGTHITVDLVWANASPRYQRWIDVFATLVLLFVVTVQTYTLFDKVVSTRADHIVTMDLQVPIWPFFLVSWIGDVSAVLLIAIRTYRLIFHPDLMHDPKIKIVE
jgi:TRAP-type C4-dicarboxylate transport system permease small subunit